MHRSGTVMVHDITDTVNLQYQPGGYRIYKTKPAVNHIGCEKAEDKSFLVFGEYTFFLLLKSMAKKHDYNIKVIRCPFIKSIPISEQTDALMSSHNLRVSLIDAPGCNIEQIDAPSVNKHILYRITLTYQVEFWEPNISEVVSLSQDNSDQEETIIDSSDSGSVKVWRVDSSQKHTIEQLLGIDRDTLIQFNKNHTKD